MLKTAGLQFSYPPHFCLRYISINLPAGARMLLKGPNGSGKSTLLRLLGGLLTPDSGSLELSAKKTAFAGHNPAVYPYLSVRENLEFWLCLQKKPESPRIPGKYSAEDALALMGLEDVSREKAASLSRGMLQRLDLARIISLNAGLVLLDEPENSLEAKYLDIFRREIAARTDAAAIWASHVLDADFKLPGAPLFTHALTLQKIKPGVFSGRVEQILGEASC